MGTTGGLLGRMRARQAAAVTVTVRPMYPARRGPLPAAERLAVVFDLFGLTAAERAAVRGRLAGQSFGEIGAARGSSRQAAQINERRALGKLGLAGSVEEIVHADQRAAGSDLARGRAVRMGELTDPDATARKLKPDPADLAHERRVGAFLRSKGVRW